jgi:hypothetical protein
LKFLPLDTSKIKETKDAQLKDQFDEWLARIVCYCFSVPVTAFVKETNRATAGTVQEAATAEGLVPLMRWVKNAIDFIIRSHIGNDDIEFNWNKNEDIDPLVQAQIDQIYVGSGIRTAIAVHIERGWDDADKPPTAEEKAAQDQTKAAQTHANALELTATKQPEGEQHGSKV